MDKKIKKIAGLIIILLFLASMVSQLSWAEVKYNAKLFNDLAKNENPLPRLAISDYQRIVLDNGMVVYLAEDHSSPAVIMYGIIRGGRSQESLENAGISNFMVNMMNTGNQAYGENQLNRFKEMHAINFNLSLDNDNFYLNGDALVSDAEALLTLMVATLRKPLFQTDYFGRKKVEFERGLKQAKTRENSLLEMYFYKALQKDHPYSLNRDLDLQLANLDKVTPERLDQFYQRSIVPNQTILLIYGDIHYQQIKETITKQFQDWPRKDIPLIQTRVSENPDSYGKIVLVDKPDATQARIEMGYNILDDELLLGESKDFFAFDIANNIFGGGDLESYLMREIRAKKGYAYDIHSQLANQPLGGTFLINTSVKPDKSYDTVTSIKKIMHDLKNGRKKFKESEVFQIINLWNAFFPESYRLKERLLKDCIWLAEVKKRDWDYLNRYIRGYNQVNAEEAQKAFAKYISADKCLTVIVGKKEDILPQFQKHRIKVEVIQP